MKRSHLKNITPYNEETYKGIQINYLIIFGIYSVLVKGEKCTFEKLVAECFNLFPKAFSFARYPQWPDSLKFDRPLRTLRENGLIVGSPKTLFTLTKFGENTAKITTKVLKQELPSRKVIIDKSGRDAEINWLRNLKNNEMFYRFLKEKKYFLITNMELRGLLRCTLETPLRIVKQNLVYSINLAEEFKEKELLKFLKFCQQHLSKK